MWLTSMLVLLNMAKRLRLPYISMVLGVVLKSSDPKVLAPGQHMLSPLLLLSLSL